MSTSQSRCPAIPLLFLRVSIFLVMFIWTVDKFVRPDHAATVYEHFYFLGGLSHQLMQILGGIEMIVLLGFLLGYKKTLTYGFVLVAHGVSTLSAFKQYLAPFEGPNLLFFAAWPMLAACYMLFVCRHDDVKLTVSKA